MIAPVILHATFTARPDQADAVAALIRDYGTLVRTEPGNVLFEVTRLRDDPQRFFVYEEYEDEASFHGHLGTPYGAEFNAALGPLIVEPNSQLTFLERV